jgi:hypothetical protein
MLWSIGARIEPAMAGYFDVRYSYPIVFMDHLGPRRAIDPRDRRYYPPKSHILGMGVMGESDGPIFGVAESLVPKIRTASDRNPNDVYSGWVLLPQHRDRARAYFKVFPPETRRQLAFNEVIAHKVAMQLGLPSPLTFPCVCRPAMLRATTRPAMACEGSQFVMGVASVDGSSGEIRQRLRSSPTTWVDLMNWPEAARTAVFDELVANDDRHLDNLVRCGTHSFLLIDSERILFGEAWFGQDLSAYRTKRCEANALAATIAESTDEVARQRMQRHAEYYVRATPLVVPENSEALEKICHAPPGATQRLIELLNYRRTVLPSLMHWHLSRGDIFQARSHK